MQLDSLPPPVDFNNELEWVKTHMHRVRSALASLGDLSGTRIAFCTHLDIKMLPAFDGLAARGAEMFFTTCNPHTVRDEVVHYLGGYGRAEAWQGMNHDSWLKSLRNAVEWQPTHLCEFGADLTEVLHEQSGHISTVQSAIEGTSSGVSRLETLELRYPVFNWNHVPAKEQLHNRRMVGLSTWHTFFERTRLTLHEKRVLVIGYGSVGQSVADSALAYGGNVCIAEQDRARALEASYAGWQVLPLSEALPAADVIVTATGAAAVLGPQEYVLLKPGAFLLNVGHRNDEMDIEALRSYPHRTIMPFIEEFSLGAGRIYLFAGGSMANLSAGYGDSLNAFDLPAAMMIAAIGFAVECSSEYRAGLHMLPRHVWESVI
jgi:adenosylhomocysteinase